VRGRSANGILAENPEEKRPLGKPKCRTKDNMQINLDDED
jgi:hypothetical protein